MSNDWKVISEFSCDFCASQTKLSSDELDQISQWTESVQLCFILWIIYSINMEESWS